MLHTVPQKATKKLCNVLWLHRYVHLSPIPTYASFSLFAQHEVSPPIMLMCLSPKGESSTVLMTLCPVGTGPLNNMNIHVIHAGPVKGPEFLSIYSI